jgi:hypothetical protein
MHRMLASSRLFFNRDSVYHKDRRARQRAKWLYNMVLAEAAATKEIRDAATSLPDAAGLAETAGALKARADQGREAAFHPDGRLTRIQQTRVFPRWQWRRDPEPEQDDERYRDEQHWGTIAEVAEDYPRLLAWLSEGQVSRYWNVFGSFVMVLRLLPGVRWFIWHFMFREVYFHAPWRAALRGAILAEGREQWNKGPHADRRKDSLPVGEMDIPGLSAVDEISVILETEARLTMRQRVANMSAGCIGVSGLRGAGKTTLISDFCAHRYGTPRYPAWPPPDSGRQAEPRIPGLRIMVQAPLVFDAREYLIHQYTCLCRTVLADVRFNPTKLGQHLLGPFLFLRPPRPGTVVGVVLLVASVVLGYQAATGRWPRLDWGWTEFAVAVLVGLVAIAWRTRRALIEVRQITNLADDAEARLRRLHFLRTDTHTGGGTLTGPLGAALSVGTSRELAEQVITLPELIDDYRDFVERVIGGLQAADADERREYLKETGKAGERCRAEADLSTDVRLVIGIDQFDQIDDADAARKFLDELSSVFGTPHCVYLVALSPDVLAAVDQQTVPLKTSSSGLFDEMIWLDPLDLNDAARLLDRRVIGLPVGFIVLCYLLSGGLPRELLRVARAVFTAGKERPSAPDRGRTVNLAEATRHVIDEEISALKKRALASAAHLDLAATPELLQMLTDPVWPTRSPGSADADRDNPHRDDDPRDDSSRLDRIEEALNDLSRLWFAKARQRFTVPKTDEVAPYTAEVCDSLLAGLYFLLTVRQLCTAAAGKVTKLAWAGTQVQRPASDIAPWLADHTGALRDLARARIALGTSPYVAAALVHDARARLGTHRDFPEFKQKVCLDFLSGLGREDQLFEMSGVSGTITPETPDIYLVLVFLILLCAARCGSRAAFARRRSSRRRGPPW